MSEKPSAKTLCIHGKYAYARCEECEAAGRGFIPMEQPSSNQSDIEPLVTALIHAVKMERDEFHERCNNSYSTDALMLCKERVALCKAAVLAAMRPAHEPKPQPSNSSVNVLRAWSGVVVDGNLSSDLAIAADEIESARRTADYWKAEHNAANAEIERLQNLLKLETAALEQACAAPVDSPITVEQARATDEPSATLPPKLDTTMPSVWHFLLVAAHEVVEAVDFNHAHKDSPLKWTVPWAKVTALRAAVLRAKELNGAGLPEPPTDVQRDAERYRWLRDKHNNCNDTLCVMDDDGMIEDRAPGFANDDPIDLDRAIDAIRATATKEAAHAESICERCDKPLSTHSLPLNRCADGERGIF